MNTTKLPFQPSRLLDFSQGNPTAQLKAVYAGLPWWSLVKNLPASAGKTGFNPWSGEIPQAAEQQTSCTTTTEA